MRSLSEISEEETVRLSIDLVAAARRNLGFLRLVTESQWLQERPTILESIRRFIITLFRLAIPVFFVLVSPGNLDDDFFFGRYDQLWMPLISDLSNGSNPPMILPPFDIEWVWYCHTLNSVRNNENSILNFTWFMRKYSKTKEKVSFLPYDFFCF